MAISMNGLLLDTTVLIDLSRGNEQTAEFIEQQQKATIFLAEVRLAQLLIAKFALIPLSATISNQAYNWMITLSNKK